MPQINIMITCEYLGKMETLSLKEWASITGTTVPTIRARYYKHKYEHLLTPRQVVGLEDVRYTVKKPNNTPMVLRSEKKAYDFVNAFLRRSLV